MPSNLLAVILGGCLGRAVSYFEHDVVQRLTLSADFCRVDKYVVFAFRKFRKDKAEKGQSSCLSG